jgi:hypothetical protein
MNNKEVKTVPRLRYVDVEDRGWHDRMQNPETWDQIRIQLLDKELKDWPDQILLADLPQVPEDEIDAPIIKIVGRCEGKILNRGDVTIETKKQQAIFLKPQSTKFVRVVREGMEFMERWNFEKHGEWEQIPDTGLTPSQLIERLYGFGDTAFEQGQQFNLVRKRKASKIDWKPDYHPKPKITHPR